MMESAPDKTPLERAKEAAGGPGGLARALGGITPQAISQWRRAPAERVLEIERVTAVPRHELRPDIYPPDSPPSAPNPSHDQHKEGVS